MSERPINTNDLREYAYTVPDRCKYLFAVAAELDATRTERNIACRALDAMAEENARLREALEEIENAETVWFLGVDDNMNRIRGLARTALKEPGQ